MVIYFLRTVLQVIVMVEAWTRSGKTAGGRARVLKRNYSSLNISTSSRLSQVQQRECSACGPKKAAWYTNNHSDLSLPNKGVSDALADRSSCLYDRYRLSDQASVASQESLKGRTRWRMGS
jgi:hypothetical protein